MQIRQSRASAQQRFQVRRATVATGDGQSSWAPTGATMRTLRANRERQVVGYCGVEPETTTAWTLSFQCT
jgi:hypothetical protein